MPLKYKSHMLHDIIVLCCCCNTTCDKERRVGAIEGVYQPAEGGYRPQFEVDQRLYKVRSSAVALTNWKERMPQEKVEEHKRVVRDYLHEQRRRRGDGGEEYSAEDTRLLTLGSSHHIKWHHYNHTTASRCT